MAFTGIKEILKEFRARILAERTAASLPDVTDGGWKTYNRYYFPLGGGIYLYSCMATNTEAYTKSSAAGEITSIIASPAYEGGDWKLLFSTASMRGTMDEIVNSPNYKSAKYINIACYRLPNDSTTVEVYTRIIDIMMVVKLTS